MNQTNSPKTVLPTTANHIANTLRERIVQGVLAGDTPLRQDHVAQEFESSHVPVREAFQQLEAQGLVVSQPRRGVRVATLSPASVKEALEMRGVLEILAFRHAAPKFGAPHIEAIEAAQSRCESADSLVAWDSANRDFHRALVSLCGMPRLLATLESLEHTNSRHLFAMAHARGWQPRSNQDHQLIISAIKSHDVERAVGLLNRHIGTMERVGFAV
jgi:DNA-binding GntR family transcriptional regulator